MRRERIYRSEVNMVREEDGSKMHNNIKAVEARYLYTRVYRAGEFKSLLPVESVTSQAIQTSTSKCHILVA